MDCVNAIVVTTLDQNNPASIWDSSTGTLVAHFRGSGSVPRHCLSISGGYLYASERGKPLVHCWPLNKQHCESRRLIAPGKIDSLDFSPDTTHAAIAVGEKLHLYQLSSGRLLGTVSKHYQPISIVKFNSTGALVGCGGQDGMITVWTLANLIQDSEPLFSSMDHNLPVCDLAFTSGVLRSRIISVSSDFSCKIFCLATGRALLSIAFPSRPTSLALAPNETAVFVGHSDGGVFESHLLAKPRKTAEYHERADSGESDFVGHEKQVSCLAVTGDSVFLVSGSHDGTIRVWHIGSRQCVRKLPQKGPVTNLMFRIFSTQTFTTGFKAKTVARSFIHSANEEAQSDSRFEISVLDNKLLEQTPTSSDLFSNGPLTSRGKAEETTPSADDQDPHLKLEVAKLKTVNNQMYNFAVKAILSGSSGVAFDSVVPFSNVSVKKPPKKAKKSSPGKLLKDQQRRKERKLRKLTERKSQQNGKWIVKSVE